MKLNTTPSHLKELPRQYSLVVFDRESSSEEIYEKYYKDIFGERTFIFFGEVPNAPGHCILGEFETGKMIGMFHTENFREATEDET